MFTFDGVVSHQSRSDVQARLVDDAVLGAQKLEEHLPQADVRLVREPLAAALDHELDSLERRQKATPSANVLRVLHNESQNN